MRPTTLVEVLLVESSTDVAKALGEAAALRGASRRPTFGVVTWVLPGFEACLSRVTRSPAETPTVALRASVGVGGRWSLCCFEVTARRDPLAEVARVLLPPAAESARFAGERTAS